MQPIEEPELTAQLIRQRADAVISRLRSAAAGAGRDPDGFRMVAVSKGFGVPLIRTALEAGLTTFGENRVQEAMPKVGAAPDADWHLVGHLQSNKAGAACRLFGTIHSIDSVALLRRVDGIAVRQGVAPTLLLQVNLTGEPTKAGFEASWFEQQLVPAAELPAAVRALEASRVAGLMTIARFGATEGEQRDVFARLRDLRDRLQEACGMALPELSMGMTADAEVAVREGSTLVRIGTAIFGPRPHP